MPERDPGPTIKDPELYESLRDAGNSKEKSARIANASAAAGRKTIASRGGRSDPYTEWTVTESRKRASELGIDGHSSMRKAELVEALRSH